jgi:hypothetical protein
VHVPALLHLILFAFRTCREVHAIPHAPQFETLRMFVSHPVLSPSASQ